MKCLIRRTAFFFLILAVVFAAGCAGKSAEPKSGESSDKEAGTEGSEAAEGPKIGISIYRYDDTFMKLYRSELKQYLEETYHAQIIMRNAGGDQNEQNRQIKEFIDSKCNGIIINPVETSAAGTIADTCSQAGIPLVFINSEPDESERKRWEDRHMAVSSVETDSKQAGTYQGQIILETPGKGDKNKDGIVSYVMIKGEAGSDAARYRSEYSIKALTEAGVKTEELFSGIGNWNREEGKKLAAQALSTYGPRIDVIFCNNDAMANGALEAVEEAGMVPGKDISLVGVDALQETVEYIKEGKITGTVLNDHQGQSRTAADALIRLIQGEDTETRYLVDYIKITMNSTFQNWKGDD
ncbi:galactose ABC transporter substrate-binding protein [Lacrimispora sp. AGF001]|jgi:methyl-galactoside transport system substrate-binding protein|uniref:galactose ABC transporter substrate-binding protein n=1 Tax=Lacrimispora sp. AGF001 TaxID=3401631 RepID=UPI003B428BE4|nr:LacI family transcriptional regulator [Paenibacillaceae bacterium]